MDAAELAAFLKFHCQRAQVSDAMVNLRTGRRIRTVLPVHLHGRVADMDPILEVAAEYDLMVVEDASQAPGALYKGRRAGTLGHAGCFSFCPEQNLGAYGEAGAVITADRELARTVAVLRDHGRDRPYLHGTMGWNSHMDGIQAAVLSVKLPYLEGWSAARRMVAEQYARHFCELDNLTCPTAGEERRHVFRAYAVRVPDRDAFMEDLRRREVETAIHYPLPIHLQEAYHFLPFQEGDFPVAETWCAETVSLPMYPELHFRQVTRIVEAVTASRANTGKIYFEAANGRMETVG
jgi:dTDP-4-amino-4,6-dideoxygalactose transaminase